MHRREFFRKAGILTGAGLVTLVANEVGHDPWKRLAGMDVPKWQEMKEKLRDPETLSSSEIVWTLARKYQELVNTLKSDTTGLAFQSLSSDFKIEVGYYDYLGATYDFSSGQSNLEKAELVRALQALSQARTAGGSIRLNYVGGSELPNLDLTQDLIVHLPLGFRPSTVLSVNGQTTWSLDNRSGWSNDSNLRLENNPYRINPNADFIAFDVRSNQRMQGQNYLTIGGQFNMSGRTGGLRVADTDEGMIEAWSRQGLSKVFKSYLELNT